MVSVYRSAPESLANGESRDWERAYLAPDGRHHEISRRVAVVDEPNDSQLVFLFYHNW